jgi:hypothetical protein
VAEKSTTRPTAAPRAGSTNRAFLTMISCEASMASSLVTVLARAGCTHVAMASINREMGQTTALAT